MIPQILVDDAQAEATREQSPRYILQDQNDPGTFMISATDAVGKIDPARWINAACFYPQIESPKLGDRDLLKMCQTEVSNLREQNQSLTLFQNEYNKIVSAAGYPTCMYSPYTFNEVPDKMLKVVTEETQAGLYRGMLQDIINLVCQNNGDITQEQDEALIVKEVLEAIEELYNEDKSSQGKLDDLTKFLEDNGEELSFQNEKYTMYSEEDLNEMLKEVS